MLLEGGVVVLVEVAHDVVGDVQQGGGLGASGQAQAGGEQGSGQQSLHGRFLCPCVLAKREDYKSPGLF
ncbi:hypothetical protein D9M68_876240 [compost metagenome]